MQLLSIKTKIWTTNVDATKSFYQQLFDLVVVEEWDDPDDTGVILSPSKDDLSALLEIYFGEEKRAHSGLSLQFRVNDLAVFENKLIALGDIDYRGPVERPWGSEYIYLTDPNNIDVIVYAKGL